MNLESKKDPKKVKSGRTTRAQGAQFELRVRKDLEEKGWIVDKWSNNVEWLEDNINRPPEEREGKLIKAKAKWAGPGRPMMMGSGFPDFVAHREYDKGRMAGIDVIFNVVGVESKMTGKLDREEKEKCRWLINNKIFSKILIASKTKVKNKIVVVYSEFQ